MRLAQRWLHRFAASLPRSSVQVGWLFNDDKSSVIFDAPERLKSVDVNRRHAKSAARCPAVIALESRYFLIRCPFDISLQFTRSVEGEPKLVNMLGNSSPMRPKGLSHYIILTPEREWRYPDRPTLQIKLPYVFISDAPVYLSQLPPFLHMLNDPWPGTLFGGRFPINIWPRPLMWAFEWHQASKPLILKRGDPWFYINFETEPADRAVQLIQAERTPQLKSYMDSISESVVYVNQTFGLFKTAASRRPKKLLEPRRT
jgi:hypothetical protein